MVKATKKIKRQRVLQKRKQAKKKLGSLENMLNNIPKKCQYCESKFNPKSDLDTWKIQVFNDYIHLICDSCFNKMQSETK